MQINKKIALRKCYTYLTLILTAILRQESSPANNEQEALFEFAFDENGTLTKVTSKNSNGRKCAGCGCRCPCNCKDCRPICCSEKNNKHIKALFGTLTLWSEDGKGSAGG
jgi:hypothetical protein